MEYYNNRLAVEATWMIDKGIISQSNYKWHVQKGSIRKLQSGGRGRKALVDYETMPQRFKDLICELVGNPYKMAAFNPLEKYLVQKSEAFEFFAKYKVNGEARFLPIEKQREYYSNAVILDAVSRYAADRMAKRHKFTKTALMGQIAGYVQELNSNEYPHSLPSNARSFERKLVLFQQEGFESLIHKNYTMTKSNAAKIKTNEQEAILVMLLSDPRNLSDAQVSRGYNKLAESLDWQPITTKAVSVWREKKADLIYARKHGEKAYNNTKAMQHKRKAPTYPLYMWTMDGWDVELLYQKKENNRVTYHNRPTMIVILDTCLKYPIGFAIGTHETPQLITEALRNAALHTEELFGQMHKTQQLQFDNYQKKTLMPKYLPITKRAIPAKVGNAKSKIIERWFSYFNQKYCRWERNTSGVGITSTKGKQPNIDFLQKEKKNFPNYQEVCERITEFINNERFELVEKYKALYNEMPLENKLPLPLEDYLLHYGATTGHKNLMQGSGLNLTINKQLMSYDCFDPSFRMYPSVRWEVRYDPANPQRAIACNENQSLRFMLEEKYVQPMALMERSEGDQKALERVNEFNIQHKTEIAHLLGEYQDTAEELLSSHLLTTEEKTLNKLLITDSTGQHKDRRNDKRRIDSNTATNAIPVQSVFDKY